MGEKILKFGNIEVKSESHLPKKNFICLYFYLMKNVFYLNLNALFVL